MDCPPGQKMVAAVQRCLVFRKRCDWTISFQVCRFEIPHCKKNLCICLAKKNTLFISFEDYKLNSLFCKCCRFINYHEY